LRKEGSATEDYRNQANSTLNIQCSLLNDSNIIITQLNEYEYEQCFIETFKTVEGPTWLGVLVTGQLNIVAW
jgi:hypothetical protein